MKLKKSIYKTNIDFYKKFENCKPKQLERGDFLSLDFLSFSEKRRGGSNFRINTQTVMLFKKNRRGNNLTFLITSLYKHEKVTWRYLITGPHMVKIKLLKKNKSTK